MAAQAAASRQRLGTVRAERPNFIQQIITADGTKHSILGGKKLW